MPEDALPPSPSLRQSRDPSPVRGARYRTGSGTPAHALPPAPFPAAAPPPAAPAGCATSSPPAPARRRLLALWLPRFAPDRAARSEPALRDAPFALWTEAGGRRLLVAASPAAERAGLGPTGSGATGLPLADAQALCPDLLLRPADPEGDAAALRRLALWALRYTPLAATDPPDGLVLDITGCAHLAGGEPALLADALARLGRAGFAAQGAIAATADAAVALARAAPGRILAPGEERAALAPLPLAALRPEPEALAALARFGLRRVGDLYALPRAPLARRAGAALLARLDAALGAHTVPLAPVCPPPEAAAARDFAEPLATPAGIAAAIGALADELAAALERAGLGARRLSLACWRVDGAVQRLDAGLSLASREPAHLRRLLAPLVERIEPGCGLERLALAAERTEPLAAAQAGLPGRGGGGATTAGPEGNGAAEKAVPHRQAELGRLVDRLAGRLGEGAVYRLLPQASHWPERTTCRAAPLGPAPLPEGWLRRPRPVRLLARPEPIAATAPLPDAPPVQFRWRQRLCRVRRAEGPERLAPEWWRDPAAAAAPGRDYYRVEDETGRRYWLYREGPAAGDGGAGRGPEEAGEASATDGDGARGPKRIDATGTTDSRRPTGGEETGQSDAGGAGEGGAARGPARAGGEAGAGGSTASSRLEGANGTGLGRSGNGGAAGGSWEAEGAGEGGAAGSDRPPEPEGIGKAGAGDRGGAGSRGGSETRAEGSGPPRPARWFLHGFFG